MNREQSERFMLLTRPDEGVLIPPAHMLEYYESIGSDPRVPKKAVGRLASTHYKEAFEHSFAVRSKDSNWIHSLGWPQEVESAARPAHYPNHWGISRIPRPDEMKWESWGLEYTHTVCYTSLNVPRPFDPHTHGIGSSNTVGFGYMYRSGSSWMDRFDVIGRRGGGNRGGFAMTTGPTSGNYPESILPNPKFDLGRLGYTNGGWNPEGIQYTNRPRKVRLTGLRSGWAHRVFMVRSRQVMFRNVYGQISTTEATPRAPMVVVNGIRNVTGVLSIKSAGTLNSPTEIIVEINNPRGYRAGQFKEYDTIQVFASPRFDSQPPLVFTGFISKIAERDIIRLTCLDSLGYLSLEPILTKVDYTRVDAAQVIREIVAGSSYPLGLGRMITTSRIVLPSGMNFVGKSRLSAVQTILDFANSTPNKMSISVGPQGNISLSQLTDPIEEQSPLIGGRSDMPLNGSVNLSKTRDYWPSRISRLSGSDAFNVATVNNDALNLTATYPAVGSADYPASPIHRVFDEISATTNHMCEFFAKQFVVSQGRGERYSIMGRPERFDIIPGDVMQFFAYDGASITGNHRLYEVNWYWSPRLVSMDLIVGRSPASLIGSLRYAVQSSK